MSIIKKLSDCLSPVSWFFAYISAFFPIVIVLQPTLLEFVILFVIDSLAIFVNVKVSEVIFLKKYPLTQYYLFDVKEDEIKAFTLNQKLELLKSFFDFPTKRAIFTLFFSFVKGIPAFCIMTFYWQHEISTLNQFLTVMGISFFSITYFSSAVFIEAHIFLSDLIIKLHKKQNWTEVFKNFKITYKKWDFEVQESIALTSIIIFTLTLNCIVILTYSDSSNYFLAVIITSIGLIGFALFARIWFLGRGYFIGGLESIFQTLDKLNYQKGNFVLGYSSSSLLSNFKKSFNHLVERLQMSERELTTLVLKEADRSHFEAIGEISALIAHDLSGPLHIAHFCVTELIEDPSKIKDKKYLTNLNSGVKSAIELVDSLRARLKNPDPIIKTTLFIDAHRHVVNLLKVQYSDSGFNEISIEVDVALNTVSLDIAQVDFIHILDNLYRNSIENLLKNSIPSPKIGIKIGKSKQERFTEILISDNGTGLKLEDFNKLTSYYFEDTTLPSFTHCLGLRLIKRLIELNQGDLSLVKCQSNFSTTFCLRLNSL